MSSQYLNECPSKSRIITVENEFEINDSYF